MRSCAATRLSQTASTITDISDERAGAVIFSPASSASTSTEGAGRFRPQLLELCRQLVDHVRDLARIDMVGQEGKDIAHRGLRRNLVRQKSKDDLIQKLLFRPDLFRCMRRSPALIVDAAHDQRQLLAEIDRLGQGQSIPKLVKHGTKD